MKKLTAILLAILMLIPLIASCGGNDETTTTEAPTTETPTTEAPTTETPTTEAPTTEAPTTEAPTTEIPTTEAPTTIDPNVPWSSKTDIRDTWNGKTLNIACTSWYGSSSHMGIPELCVKEGEESKFGVKIDTAVLERNEYIEDTYGVKLNFIIATKENMPDALEKAALAENINYDLCMPRMMNAQEIVVGGHLYDLANREFIDFRNSYYSENSVKTYTAHERTFFVNGSFSLVDKELALVLFFNKNLLGDGSKEASDELYQLVRDDKWTYDKLISYASAVYSDNGDANDPYRYTRGAHFLSYARFYDYFGVKQAGVDTATGKWEITLNDDKVDNIINTVINSKKSAWFDEGLQFGAYSYKISFAENTLLFADNQFYIYPGYDCDYVGVIPFPMLNEEQGGYYVPTHYQLTVLMCIPKTTQNREMSEYFMDVLCWTGEDYTMKAYIETKKDQFKDDVDIEMITDYIIPNISYDVGGIVGNSELLPNVKSNSWQDGENKFDEFYAAAEPDALKTIAEWNATWGGYTEE